MSDDDDLRGLQSLTRVVRPLPGGLIDLRERIDAARDHRRARARWLGLAAVASAAAVALALLLPRALSPSDDLDAARALFSEPGVAPHPEAVALGLAAAPATAQIPDPRLAGGDVVFFWVQPTSVGEAAGTVE